MHIKLNFKAFLVSGANPNPDFHYLQRYNIQYGVHEPVYIYMFKKFSLKACNVESLQIFEYYRDTAKTLPHFV